MILLGALIGTAARIFTPWSGAWTADVDFGLADLPVMPSGKTTLAIGTDLFVGTIDPRASGPYGDRARARIIGGGGGWDQLLPRRYFANDAGVTSLMVRQATGIEAGEIVVELAPPTVLGAAYTRLGKQPAGAVLPGGGWYVTQQGITTVGPRVPIPPDTTITLVSWDPLTQVAELATETVILPGTILVDPKLGATTKIVRDVEQTWNEDGVRVKVWCGDDARTRLVSALSDLARRASRVELARSYRYRVVATNVDGRLVLQAVDPDSGAPDMLPISVWPGIPGAKVLPKPASIVGVEFMNGDPSLPRVTSFEGSPTAIDPVAKSTSIVEALTAISVWSGIATAAFAKLAAVGAVGPEPVTVPPGPFAAAAAAGGTVAAAIATALPLIPAAEILLEEGP